MIGDLLVNNALSIVLAIFSFLILLWIVAILNRRLQVALNEISMLKNDISIINNEIDVLMNQLKKANLEKERR